MFAICMFCNGIGWCEGSPAFTCPRCGGTGTEVQQVYGEAQSARSTPPDDLPGKSESSSSDPLREALIALVEKERKHVCQSCDLDDEERAHREGWNAALYKVKALLDIPPGPKTEA